VLPQPGDLEILDSRDKIAFAVSPEVRQIYRDKIIPFWQGKSMRELILRNDRRLAGAYEAGIFTEFMEQRSPGPPSWMIRFMAKGFSISRPTFSAAWPAWIILTTRPPTTSRRNSRRC